LHIKTKIGIGLRAKISRTVGPSVGSWLGW